jgi:hypothetical protein
VAVKILTPAISKTDAIAYILLLQAASYIVVTVWGLIGLRVYSNSNVWYLCPPRPDIRSDYLWIWMPTYR